EGAAGDIRVLTERWDGTGWRLLAAPNPFPGGNSLGSVSCLAADSCMAIGSPDFDSLAEQWDGRSWQVRRSGQIDVLSSVSCPSAARCMAVGSYVSRSDRVLTLAEAWNGRRWLHRDPPTPMTFQSLSDVSCVRSSFCLAVGIGVAERWNGTRWRAVKAPPGRPSSVSCSSATRCVAVGGAGAAGWNGRRGGAGPAPRVCGSRGIRLSDVSRPAAPPGIPVREFEPPPRPPPPSPAPQWE